MTNSTGGEAEHILNEEELPNHSHQQTVLTSDGNNNPVVGNGTGSFSGAV